ncbi:MAG TPA: YihY/virulence factor BrkB family protein [Bryobacteraceae bacterium]|nr:YihY/virulence factor BrkB family protein [Bryobacteraceae bacterium]
MVKRTLALLQRAAWITYQENCLSISKGAAYSALLAFFPVLTTLATLLVQAQANSVLQVMSHFLEEIVPPGAEELVLKRFAVEGQRPLSVLIGATLISLYAASGLMLSLMEGFNAVYHVPVGRPWWKQRGYAALLVLTSALPAVGASALILFGDKTERWMLAYLSGDVTLSRVTSGLLFAGQVLRLLVSFSAVVLVTMLLYRIGPRKRQSWAAVWRGSIVATVLWFLLTLAFGWYVRNLSNYNVMYGSVATVIALIVWMYMLSIITLFGCAYNAAYEYAVGAGVAVTPPTSV